MNSDPEQTDEQDEEPAAWAMMTEAYRRIGETVPAGAIAWCEANRPELLGQADAAEETAAEAYYERDLTRLEVSLVEVVVVHEAMTVAFTEGEPLTLRF